MGAVYALLILFVGVCLYIIPSSFTQPEAVVEGTPYDTPVRYVVTLFQGCGGGMIQALREYNPTLPILEAARLCKGQVILVEDVPIDQVTRLMDLIHKYEPSADVQISNNKFNDTYTINEWKEFHNDRS
jgi:hypothetical protein